MKNISEILENVKTVGIGGHIRPDGALGVISLKEIIKYGAIAKW